MKKLATFSSEPSECPKCSECAVLLYTHKVNGIRMFFNECSRCGWVGAERYSKRAAIDGLKARLAEAAKPKRRTKRRTDVEDVS